VLLALVAGAVFLILEQLIDALSVCKEAPNLQHQSSNKINENGSLLRSANNRLPQTQSILKQAVTPKNKRLKLWTPHLSGMQNRNTRAFSFRALSTVRKR